MSTSPDARSVNKDIRCQCGCVSFLENSGGSSRCKVKVIVLYNQVVGKPKTCNLPPAFPIHAVLNGGNVMQIYGTAAVL